MAGFQIDTAALATLNRFNAFARAAGTESREIARLAPGGAGNAITAATTDAVHALRRSDADKQANNDARAVFRDALAALFGGFDKIPPEVKAVFKEEDYGKGRPLTARRIAKVHAAVTRELGGRTDLRDGQGHVLALAADGTPSLDVERTNRGIEKAFGSNGSPDALPADIREPIRRLLSETAARFGTTAPGATARLTFVAPDLPKTVGPLVRAATAEGRLPDAGEILAAIRDELVRGMAVRRFKELVGELTSQPGREGVTFRARAFLEGRPALLGELVRAETPEGFRAAFKGCRDEVVRVLGGLEQLEEFRKTAPARAQAEIARQLGIPEGQAASIKTDGIADKIERMKDDFAGSPGMDPDLKKPMAILFGDFVAGFVDRCLEARRAEAQRKVSAELAKAWEKGVLAGTYPKDVSFEKICGAASGLDGDELVEALKERELEKAFAKLNAFARKLEKACVELAGGAQAWAEAGTEGRHPVKSAILEVLVERTEGLKEALDARRGELAGKYEDALPAKGQDTTFGNDLVALLVSKALFTGGVAPKAPNA